jgi:hypothetical protein
MAIRKSSNSGIPFGNTASRPASPVVGQPYYNGQIEALEIYNGTSWKVIKSEGFPPNAPTISSVTDSSTSLAYSSTAGTLDVVFVPAGTGGTATQYNAFTTAGGHSAFTTVGETVTITGLTPGTAYTVYGNAQNGSGVSANTENAAAVTPTTKPQAPTIGTATPGNLSASLTFTAPANNGGSSITNYKYSIDGTNYIALSPASTTSPLTISGLTNGTTYNIRLKAVNANGDSTESSDSNSITPPGTATVDYLVVAGGGGGGGSFAGGGGGGGYRTSIGGTSLTLDRGTTYTATVGSGGNGGSGTNNGNKGTDSTFSTITSTGGGYGGGNQGQGGNGGSGGGSGGLGNDPSTSPAQGSNAGTGGGHQQGAGGGAGGVGANGSVNGANGGSGASNSISGSSVTYAGGGGGSTYWADGGNQGPGNGGSGGGGRSGYGQSQSSINGVSGTSNTGGGGGGAAYANGSHGTGGAGGSGIIIISSNSAAASTTGSPVVTTSGGYNIYQFNNTGSITF